MTLLDDRGWGAHGPPDVWRGTTLEEMQAVARTVVGPDEPYGGRSQIDMEEDHWAHLASILRQHGVPVEVEELRQAPHDVELGHDLLTRITTS